MPKPTRIPKVNRLLTNESELLSLAQIGKLKQTSPSEILKIEDSLTAFEFDAACNFVLEYHINEREAKRQEILIKSIAAMLGGNVGDTDASDAEVW